MTLAPITDRLQLRPMIDSDIDPVLELAGDIAIAETMISVPHPLVRDDVAQWATFGAAAAANSPHRYFAVLRRTDDAVIGAVALRHIDREHLQAELSFWVGRPFWGQGFAREAAAAIVGCAFRDLGMNRIEAYHMVRNEGSGRVLRHLGFEQEGLLRERVRKWNRFEDVAVCALLRSRYERTERQEGTEG